MSEVTSGLLTFQESNHTYTLDGKPIPSVSKILEPISYEVYRNIPEYIMENARNRGKTIHRAIEIDYKFNQQVPLPEEYQGYFNAYLQFKADKPHIKFLDMEQRVYNRRLWYSGTYDIRALDTLENKIILIDTKTNTDLKIGLVELQQSLYYMAYANMCAESKDFSKMPKAIWVLNLNKDGTYEFLELRLQIEDAKNCVDYYNFRTNVLKRIL